MTAKKLVSLVAAALLAVFVIGNFETANVWFLGIQVQMPLAFLVVVSAILGAVSAVAWGWLSAKAKS
jgi:uncharacterized integral membrane protein